MEIFPRILRAWLGLGFGFILGISSRHHVGPTSIDSCCQHLNNNKLLQCIMETTLLSSANQAADTKIVVVTSFTNNIELYAEYAIAINANYAQFRKYGMRIINESSYANPQYLDADSRWNKVLFIRDELQRTADFTQVGEIGDDRFLVWFDADLAVINFDLDIADIVKNHPRAHIIMSKDKKTAPFVGNTGAIIVRISDWSASFLDLWWHSYDRSRCCDQNALTWLMDRNLPHDVKDKIVFLPADTINTDFPCWRNHNEKNRVLHLAGLTNLLRIEIFKHGYKEICRSSSVMEWPEKQLGLDADYIRSTVMKLYYVRLKAIDAVKSSLQTSFTDINIQNLRKVRLEVFDIIKQDDYDPDFGLCTLGNVNCHSASTSLAFYVYEVRKLIFEKFFSFVTSTKVSMIGSINSHLIIPNCSLAINVNQCADVFELYKDFVSAGFELLISALDTGTNVCANFCIESMKVVAMAIEIVLDNSRTIRDVQAAFLYYHFKHLLLSSSLTASEQEKVTLLEKAIAVWRNMSRNYQYFGTNYVVADPQKEYIETLLELGTRQCQLLAFKGGLKSLQDAITAQEEMIRGYQSIKIATEDIIQSANKGLAELLYNYALCTFEAGNTVEAANVVERILFDKIHHGNELSMKVSKLQDYLAKEIKAGPHIRDFEQQPRQSTSATVRKFRKVPVRR